MLRQPGTWLAGVVLPSVGFSVGLALLGIQRTDLAVADYFYSRSAGVFLARHDPLFESVLHRGGDQLVGGIAACALVVVILGWLLPTCHRYRREALYVLLSISMTVAFVALAKRATNVDCPWALARYGSDRPYIRLFADRPAALPRGECFPGAHSAGAFSLLSLALCCRTRQRRVAASAFVALLGLGYASVQWARGAHFVSHDYCSAWCAWLICVTLRQLMFPARNAEVHSPPLPPHFSLNGDSGARSQPGG